MDYNLPNEEAEIDAFIAAFEAGTLPPGRFTHAAHVLTGACYVYAFGRQAATDRMRQRVRAFNLAAGGQNTATSGYHETITVFWIALIAKLRKESATASRSQFAHAAVQHFADHKQIVREYYSFDLLASEEARREWIAPDLQELNT
jgi:hypothetical protein